MVLWIFVCDDYHTQLVYNLVHAVQYICCDIPPLHKHSSINLRASI